MRKIGMKISVCMGITLSLILSLTGTLTSGHFTVPMFLKSFLCSAVISIVIGLLIPMGRVNQAVVAKAGLQPHSLQAGLLEALVSNLIFTPLITFLMVFMAWKNIAAHAPAAAVPPFAPMFLKSLLICFVVGYVAIFLIQPRIMKLFLPKEGGPGPRA